MKRLLLSTLVLCYFGFSCLSPPLKKHRYIRLSINSDPPSLDPRKTADTTSINVLSMCFDGLMRRNKEGQISPSIAESFTVSEDGLYYTFLLKKTLWSDGHPLTAYDFENSFRTILSPTFPSEIAPELYIIKNGKKAKEGKALLETIGVRALNDQTLWIELEYAAPYFIDMLASHSFYPIPSHKLAEIESSKTKSSLPFIGNGPYRITSWKHYNAISLEKNPYYHDRENVALENIDILIVENDMTQLSMYENDEIDWIGSPLSSLPTDALCELAQREDFNCYPTCGTYYYVFNTKAFPFDNVHIRKAFSLAIHREQIIYNILQGKQQVATSLIPPTMKSVYQGYFTDNDTHLAKIELHKGLEELQLELKDLPVIKLSYNTNSTHHVIAQAIQQQWQRSLGVTVQLENMEWKVFLDRLSAGSFQLARMGGLASFNDPTSFLKDYQYENTRINQAKWSHPKYCALLEESDVEQDREKRSALLKEAEALLIQDMPIAPIYFYSGSYLKNPKVEGVVISELGEIDFKYATKQAP